MKKYKVYVCKPYWKHLFQKFPKDYIHQIHKWSAGIILIEHKEPDGRMASEHHKQYIIGKINNKKGNEL